MSVEVRIPELRASADRYGEAAYLVASEGSGSPRITHVAVGWATDDGGPVIVVQLGRSACRALAANPMATVLWPATEGESMSLIVDAEVLGDPPAGGGEVRLTPRSAVRHRPAPLAAGG